MVYNIYCKRDTSIWELYLYNVLLYTLEVQIQIYKLLKNYHKFKIFDCILICIYYWYIISFYYRIYSIIHVISKSYMYKHFISEHQVYICIINLMEKH